MDAFSRLAFVSVVKDKRPQTILAHFRDALAFYYRANPHKKYAFLACDMGTEFKGELKR